MAEQLEPTTTVVSHVSGWTRVQPWLSLLMRLAMVAILVAAAVPKMTDLGQSVRAVRAYRLLPEPLVPFIGTALPFLELALAIVLFVGLFTRAASIVWLIMMAAFMTGVIWVWTHGYSIDCGCFGGGGDVTASETNYPVHMAERLLFVAMGTFLAVFPRSALSIDAWIRGDGFNGRPRDDEDDFTEDDDLVETTDTTNNEE